ncbi:MAG: ROK family protein [Anaerolineaceae bacterium]|jgi:fructokinase
MITKLYGGIEGGGTKFICAVADSSGQILVEERIPTTDPTSTLGACARFFLTQQSQLGALTALGIACFGPLDPRKNSPHYGKILATPKPSWAGTDVVAFFARRLGLPIAFDTDVNGAVLADHLWGAGKGIQNLVYFTIGTGIGGGLLLDGRLVHSGLHLEMGHMRIPIPPEMGSFKGVCPFHGNCFEGLASGPAVEARWGCNAADLPDSHPAWELEARLIAHALHNTACLLAPERIILGGGVTQQTKLFPLIREHFVRSLNGYLQLPVLLEEIETYIVPSALEGKAGLLGAIALAQGIN